MAFDNIMTKILKPKSVEWTKPTQLLLDMGKENEKPLIGELLKGAETFLHEKIDIKPNVSKVLYKKADDIWRQLRDRQLSKCKDEMRIEEQFELNKNTVAYISTEMGDIVDIVDMKTVEAYESFEEDHQRFIIDITTRNTANQAPGDCKNGLYKGVFYDKNITDLPSQDFVPVVIIEMNHKKSDYKVYTGILIYKPYVFIPSMSCELDEDKYSDFVRHINIASLLEYSSEKAPELYDAYLKFKENPVEISVRELTSLLGRVGYGVELKSDEEIAPISNFTDETNSQKVQDFYNKFRFVTGENCYDLMRLSEFRKTFRYNKLTILDTLEILSKEYLNYESGKLTTAVLSEIVYKLYDTSKTDKSQVTMIEQEREG